MQSAMANPHPVSKFQKGHKLSGRKPGQPNLVSRDIKTLIREAAAEVGFVERVRPTSQSLPSFLAQALEETIFHHIAHSATVSFTIDLFDPPGCRESPLRMQFPGRRGACPANRLWRHPRGLP